MRILEKCIAFKTIVVREVLRFSRIWIQTVLPAVIVTALYFVIFGELLGKKIGNVAGVSYIEFIVPGLILMTVITNSYANVVSSFYSSKFQKNIEEMLVSPVPNYIILLGFSSGGIARGLVVGSVVMLVSFVFVDLKIYNYFVVFSMLILTAMLFSIAGLINGIYAKSFDDITVIPTFILTPLTYLGGIFYSISLLPDFWKHVATFNPIFYMVNAFRYGVLGISDVPLLHAYSIVITFIVVLYVFALYLLRQSKGLRH